MGIIVNGVAGREYALRATFLLAIAGVVASPASAHAINPHSPARVTAEQRLASQVNDLRKQVTRMEDEIAQIHGELVALREQKVQAEQALPATKEPQTDTPAGLVRLGAGHQPETNQSNHD